MVDMKIITFNKILSRVDEGEYKGVDEGEYKHPLTLYNRSKKNIVNKEDTKIKYPQYSKYLDIKTIYENANKVFPGLFALSESEGKDLPDLLLRYILPKLSCKKKLSEKAWYKAYELNRILNETHCGNIYKPRYRRQSVADGSTTVLTICYDPQKQLPTENNVVYLAKTCGQRNILQTRFPPIINEVVCGDATCLRGEGVATQLTTTMRLRRDVNKVGKERLGEWEEYQSEIKTGCSCNLKRDSVLLNLAG
ncbi:uncharacterized protein LOC101235290 isoform X1 [Hydra vulgaris]|uniref:uncharacterized protein LOC101235290 isoform X1 n=1 Tax=Hydra vulgaris TaxID=6087 RepID=UPI00064160E5